MRRLVILIALLAAAGAALYYSERHKQESRVGPEAMLNALADTQRELSRVPASVTRISDEEEIRIGDGPGPALCCAIRQRRSCHAGVRKHRWPRGGGKCPPQIQLQVSLRS